MSRHVIPSLVPDVTVVVGWDNPLSTFFAQVTRVANTDDEADPVILWSGGTAREVQSVEDLAKGLAHYAVIPDAVLAQLRADRAASADRGPSPLQRHMLASLGRRS